MFAQQFFSLGQINYIIIFPPTISLKKVYIIFSFVSKIIWCFDAKHLESVKNVKRKKKHLLFQIFQASKVIKLWNWRSRVLVWFFSKLVSSRLFSLDFFTDTIRLSTTRTYTGMIRRLITEATKGTKKNRFEFWRFPVIESLLYCFFFVFFFVTFHET